MFCFKFRHIVLFFLMLSLSSCAYQKEYAKVNRSGSSEEKFNFAVKAYDKGDYKKSIVIFEELLPMYRGKDGLENVLYNLAYAYFYEKDYYMASYYFKMLGRMFPTGNAIEESSYMGAYCKVLESPYFKLDQTATREAIKQLQLFINYYPNSPKVAEATTHIAAMRDKLARKAFDIANMYYKRSLYNAASISYTNFMRDYPESLYREEAAYKMIKSRFLYAENSIRIKQLERYLSVGEGYEIFLRSYSNSKYRKEVDNYYNVSQSKIK